MDFILPESDDLRIEYFGHCKDSEVLRYKKILTENVPYRLQAPFLDLKTNDWTPMVEGRLYAPDLSKDEFGNRLSEIVLPVYQSAKSAGFREWEYTAI